MSAAADERLRQEREAFEVNRRQSVGWFWAQMTTCGVILAILVAVACLCGFVVLNPERFGPWVTGSAVTGLIGELAGVILVYVRFVLSPSQRRELTPVSKERKG